MPEHDGITNVFKPSHGGGHEGGLASALPLLLAGHSRDGFGGMAGLGGGFLGGILASALFRGRGGLFGGDSEGSGGAESRIQNNTDTLAILTGISRTSDAVAGGFANTALGLSQGFAWAYGVYPGGQHVPAGPGAVQRQSKCVCAGLSDSRSGPGWNDRDYQRT